MPRALPQIETVKQAGLFAALLAVAGCVGGSERELPESPDRVRVVAYNIHHGEGMDEVVDLERIARLISQLEPDLVALQEVDQNVERTGFVDQAKILGELTGLQPSFGAFMDYQGGEYGMAVLSRWPILESRNLRLPDGAEPRSALAVRVRSPASGEELVFVGIHLYRTEEERLAQASSLADQLSDESAPVILAGDFNSRLDSPVLSLLAESWTFIEKGRDHFTFPSVQPDREIDFIAYRPQGRFELASQRLIDEPVASDHRPLFVELVFRPRSR